MGKLKIKIDKMVFYGLDEVHEYMQKTEKVKSSRYVD